MTQLKTLKCDRCGVHYHLPVKERSDSIVFYDGRTMDERMQGFPPAYEKDLCADCAAILNIVMSKTDLDKQIGDLID
jgi:hypothetical protein